MNQFIVVFNNTFLNTPEYFKFDIDNGVIELTLNPHFATLFDTKKAAQKAVEQYTNFISSNYSIVSDVKQHIERYQHWIEGGSVNRTIPIVDQSLSYDCPESATLEDLLQWFNNYSKKSENEVKYDHYSSWKGKFYKLAKNIYEPIFFHDKDYSTRFLSFELYVFPNSDYENFEKEIQTITPYITMVDEESEAKMCSIFEHTLSEYCPYYFLIFDDNRYAIKAGQHIEKTFDDLKSCFDYWKREHYYEN